MKDFVRQLSNKFKSIYLIWIIFNFLLLMLGSGISRHIDDFYPFDGFHVWFYDYSEFLVYTITPILLYYSFWLWGKEK